MTFRHVLLPIAFPSIHTLHIDGQTEHPDPLPPVQPMKIIVTRRAVMKTTYAQVKGEDLSRKNAVLYSAERQCPSMHLLCNCVMVLFCTSQRKTVLCSWQQSGMICYKTACVVHHVIGIYCWASYCGRVFLKHLLGQQKPAKISLPSLSCKPLWQESYQSCQPMPFVTTPVFTKMYSSHKFPIN